MFYCAHGNGIIVTRKLISRIILDLNISEIVRWWWRVPPLIPALRRQRQADLCEFNANLVYKTSSKTTGATQRNPALKNQYINITHV